ncbi:hypothetical protein FHS18_003225 [Paenibacillus phyllosphaerae]|uniref:Uncharacterized protein n=1 Tax=Paenibacillus phyllosphaerae TaxID=274593 RepID=A0A7W5AYN1_9BACL|nr:DUF438 domain-containing protein [Paenibacillus phyllosphaerae]MBB3111157.1 hypothetical protein [Paenibacillus phyllosphaerae]
MSELINNREQFEDQASARSRLLKNIFLDLYNGKSVKDVKTQFDATIGRITVEEAAELSRLQKEILEERKLPQEEIVRLTDAHLSIIAGKIVGNENTADEPGHPIHTFKLENRAIEKEIENLLLAMREFSNDDSMQNNLKLQEVLNAMLDIDKHYTRKEQLLFPYLEKYGITGPSVNMWRMDDYIRDSIKEAKRKLVSYTGELLEVMKELEFAVEQISGMIYREENILFPMALRNLTEDEWVKIAHESDEIGFCLMAPYTKWKPAREYIDSQTISAGYVKMETGILSLKQLELIFNHLPIDITFIDHKDIVRYFSHGKERVFARTKAVIGRTVQNCHPPKSAHIVEALLDDFKSGRKDCEDFWIKVRDKYVYIRYFAVRDENGDYIGTLEFTQNIGPIQAIEGEKRIRS